MRFFVAAIATILFPAHIAFAASGSIAPKIHVPVLLYHYVEQPSATDAGRKAMTIAPSVLENQLKALQGKQYETVFVRDIPAFLEGTKTPPKNPVALTFDDGYEDFYADAFPILKKYNVVATLYVISSFIGKGGYLTSGELKDIIASGLVEIGAHTVDHPHLSRHKTAEQRSEVVDSKKTLERDFGIDVDTFAYPYGDYDKRTITIVNDAGFTAAVTTNKGTRYSAKDILTIPRLHAGAFLGKNKWKTLAK